MIDCVINYYSTPHYPPTVRASAQFCASCYRADPQVSSVILVDGSGADDPDLQKWCDEIGVQYLHTGQSLSFADGFNRGIAECQSPWIALSACDIYIPHGFFSSFFKLTASLDPATIGCLIPALSFCDIPSQERISKRVRSSALMSLNLNIFPANVLSLIGGVPGLNTGGYNDIEITLSLRRQHLSIYQLPIQVLHYGRLTISQGSSFQFEEDRLRFFSARPELYSANSLCNLKLDHFITGWRGVLFKIERNLLLGRLHYPVQRFLWRHFG